MKTAKRMSIKIFKELKIEDIKLNNNEILSAQSTAGNEGSKIYLISST